MARTPAELACQSIGREIRLKIDDSGYIRGKIKTAQFVGWKKRGKKKDAIFQVVVQAGMDMAYEHCYHVTSLPNPESQEVAVVKVEEYKETIPQLD